MPENNDILFDDYLNYQLSSDERTAFEQRLLNDADFKNEFDLHLQTLHFIEAKGVHDLKNELNVVYSDYKTDIENKPYKPSINGGGFSFLSFFFKIIFVAFVISVVSTILILTNHFPIHHPKIDAYKNWTQEIQQKYFQVKVDTVYYEIQSTDVKKGDTIIDFPDQRIIKSHSTFDTISNSKVKIKSTFKVDSSKIKVKKGVDDGGNAAVQL